MNYATNANVRSGERPAQGLADNRPPPDRFSGGHYQFTNAWFASQAQAFFDQIIIGLSPRRVLEVGSYEGASACYLIDRLAARHELELHCVDHWRGGIEHQRGGSAETDMRLVKSRFDHNTKLATAAARHAVTLKIHHDSSDHALSKLLSDGKENYFDFIYIDGSHEAPNVLTDAVLGFKLLKIGGLMAFDDYLWSEPLPQGIDPIRCPKPAIDAFINLNVRKLTVGAPPFRQMLVKKIAD